MTAEDISDELHFESDGWRPREEPPGFEPGAHAPSVLRSVGDAFVRLHSTETASVAMAAYLVSGLATAGAPPALLGVGARVVEDEVRHVGVCERVLDALHVEQRTRSPWSAPATSPDADARIQMLASIAVTGFVVGETLSEASLSRTHAHAQEPLLRWALAELLRDEVRHGAFGIDAGAWLMRDWSPARRQTLWPECVGLIEGYERRLGGPVTDELLEHEARRMDWDVLAHYGVLRPSEMCSVFSDCIARRLVPRLTRLGVPAGQSHPE